MNTKKGDATDGGAKKIGFSLATNKKAQNRATSAALSGSAFSDDDEDQSLDEGKNFNTDIPKKPLVIPCQKDSRQSLQEQARARRQKEAGHPDVVESGDVGNHDAARRAESKSAGVEVPIKREENTQEADGNSSDGATTDRDRAAIEALEREAAAAQGGGHDGTVSGSGQKRVIAVSGDTFQRQRERERGIDPTNTEDQKKLDEDIEDLPPDISVKSQVYKKVPIGEFGAAMLRGMGWTGGDNNSSNKRKNNDATTMPRPSRLGLGATPKMFATGDAPDTHSRRRPRRQDQVQREERLKQQQQEMEKERQRQLALDKQRVLQIGSIVYVQRDGDRSRKEQLPRARIKQLAGVPGLNMILVQYEGDAAPTKTKKGSIELVDRSHLNERPFQEAEEDRRKKSREGDRGERERDPKRSSRGDCSDGRRRDKMGSRDRRYRASDDYEDGRDKDRERDRDRTRDRDRRDRERDRERNRDRDRDRVRDRDRDRDKRDRDRRYRDGNCDRDRERLKRKRDDEIRRGDDSSKRHQISRPSGKTNSGSLAFSESWLTPNIRVRIVSSKYGRSMYKEKAVVVDVTRNGVATLKTGSGQVLTVPERHLETALPKAGGNAIILSGDQRFSKGQLLERDGKKNRGVVQIFEDMSVVTTSLDDMAEWCGPLDDDLAH